MSGSPYSTLDENAPSPDLSQIGHVPILRICYGAQYLAHSNGAVVLPSQIREYGRANLSMVDQSNALFSNVKEGSQVWMSHGDTISNLPNQFKKIASTKDVNVAGYQIEGEQTYGIQFHPEVFHSTDGKTLFSNFCYLSVNVHRTGHQTLFVEQIVVELKHTKN